MSDPADFSKFNAGQMAFIDQQTRIHLVRWCELQLHQTGKLEEFCLRSDFPDLPYWDYAVLKGWVSSKKEMVTSKGFKTAASMVKKGSSVLS